MVEYLIILLNDNTIIIYNDGQYHTSSLFIHLSMDTFSMSQILPGTDLYQKKKKKLSVAYLKLKV